MDPVATRAIGDGLSTSARPVGAPGGNGAMSAPTAKGKLTGSEKLERELLARLGLDPSATPEDVSAAHETVSAYLAAAPRGLRSWARTQAAGADEAYALLTDPAALARAVALVGASARSAVLPGGSATPPAHRDTPAPAAAAAVPAAAALAGGAPLFATPRYDEDGRRIVSDDEIDALLAEVDPTAHREVVGTAAQRAAAAHAASDGTPRTGTLGALLGGLLASSGFRNLALAGAVVAAIVIVAVLGYGPTTGAGAIGPGANPAASAAASAAVLDQAKVADLMAKIQANPKDADSLMALGDEYYRVGDFKTAGDWFTKVTVLEPGNVRSFLALGAAAFNEGDMAAAEVAWKQVLVIDDKNVEAHYDLGFLYFNRQPPDMAAVQREWNRVVELAPGTELAKTVQAHLTAIASLVPASPATSPAPTPAPSASPAASPSGSPAPAASAAPSPAPSAVPSAAPSGSQQP
jgi:cytochrome c-type biogenesis protein CcmH/NrfG